MTKSREGKERAAGFIGGRRRRENFNTIQSARAPWAPELFLAYALSITSETVDAHLRTTPP